MKKYTISIPNEYPEIFGETDTVKFTIELDKDKDLLTFIIDAGPVVGHLHNLSEIHNQLFRKFPQF